MKLRKSEGYGVDSFAGDRLGYSSVSYLIKYSVIQTGQIQAFG